MNVTILGAGAWGTALARLLCQANHHVTLWGHNPVHLDHFRQTRVNERYLPGIELTGNLSFVTDAQQSISEAACIIVAVPSKAFRQVTTSLAAVQVPVVSVTKGIEFHSGLTMCGILRCAVPQAPAVALSGPTLADEVARDVPSAIVAASESAEAASLIQQLFHRPTFRVYTTTDVKGVELGGALKNVIAIAAGMCDGLGFGDNSKAALITRGIAEMRRLIVACGGLAETVSGLSGIGDLTVTCFSRLSRNRKLGERLSRGEKLADLLAHTAAVAEGVPTAQSAYRLARQLNVITPIIDQVYAMLYEQKEIRTALRDLTSRDSKCED